MKQKNIGSPKLQGKDSSDKNNKLNQTTGLKERRKLTYMFDHGKYG